MPVFYRMRGALSVVDMRIRIEETGEVTLGEIESEGLWLVTDWAKKSERGDYRWFGAETFLMRVR